MRNLLIIIAICIQFKSTLGNSAFFQAKDSNLSKRELTNVLTFAEIYGYIRYFHPTEESKDVDWDKFVIYSLKKVYSCSNDIQLIDTLNLLYNKIAPQVLFFNKKNLIQKNNQNNRAFIYWHHWGIETNCSKGYKSNLVSSDSIVLDQSLLKDTTIQITSTFSSISFILPIKTDLSKENNKHEASEFINNINNYTKNDIQNNSKEFKMACSIITWNIFKHFGPYRELLKINWTEVLKENILKNASSRSNNEFLLNMREMLAKFNDGHIIFNSFENNDRGYYPAIELEKIEGKIIISNVIKSNIDLKIGDEILKFNNMPIAKYLEEQSKYISASTLKNLEKKALKKILEGGENSSFDIQIKQNDVLKNLQLERKINAKIYDEAIKSVKPIFKELNDNIWYLNLSRINNYQIDSLMQNLLKSKGIICDLRGYPNQNKEFLSYLITNEDTAKWIGVENFIFPNNTSKNQYSLIGWALKPNSTHINSPIVFLTNSNAISFSESYLSLVKHYKLGKIIGETTGGTNGDINCYNLFNKYYFYFTGARVLKLNGEQHHGIGINPDIEVEKKLNNFIKGEDDYIIKAIEVINSQ
jgi:C-terminal processing protease CtpA/Prc